MSTGIEHRDQIIQWNSLATLMTRHQDEYFLQNIIYLDQFGYTKHARAFRTQIGLNKKNNLRQFGYGKHGRA